ncbi:MAG: flagellar hook-basal body complex protein FliE [SAR324 cluster bacterium]|nr:flagellar hook-basal body complex protein FliE [SAR324 cluster bacterium]
MNLTSKITGNLANRKMTESVSTESNGLGKTFEDMLTEVNQTQMEAEKKQTEFMTSQKKDLHGTIIAMEKADLSLRLMMQVRNKVVSAYEEVMRMQI